MAEWLADELKAVWQTEFPAGSGNFIPATTGVPSCTYECDLTVDHLGNPHLAVVIANAATPEFPTPTQEALPEELPPGGEE